MKGCQGEREIARKKEMKRRRERGTGAVDSRNRQWQESCSKDMSWFKVDIPHMGKPAHLFQSLLSFLGLHPKGVHYNPCSILEDRVESLVMEPISSQMACGGNQVKIYSMLSFRGKPPPMERDARVLFFLHRPWFSCSGSVGSGSLSITYFLYQ